jgi:uncharacterized protein (TIGR03435 family)
MRQDEENVARLLKEALPSAERMELARVRALERLRAANASGDVPREILEDRDSSRPVRAWWQTRPVWLAPAIAAGLAALVLLSIPIARRFVANRSVYAIVDNEGGARYRVACGQIVATDVWTRLTVTLPDGSRVEMRPQSQLSVNDAADGLRIRLDRGGIIVNAARQRTGHLYVDTKDVAVSVVGTVFLVGVEEAGSRVAVLEGKVQVKQGGLTKTLLPPEQMATNPLMELPPLREQFAWSRYAPEHLALLPQESAPVVAKQAEKPVETVQAQAPSNTPQLNPPKPAAARPQFEVASVKRNTSGSRGGGFDARGGRYSTTNMPLMFLIQQAYKVQTFQIIGAPAWIESERYDIEARAADTQKKDQMLQSLIEERFKAVVHGETRDLPVFFLTVAKNGSKLKSGPCLTREPNTPVPPNTPQSSFCGFFGAGNGSIRGTSQPIENLADFLSRALNRKVLDRTGLAGQFDFDLKWTPDINTAVNSQEAAPEGGPSIFTAIEEQLGLKLESGKAPIDVLVIDRIDHPSDN